MTLNEYFHAIINKQPAIKEPTMFDNLKTSWVDIQANFMSLWTKPVAFVEEEDHPKLMDDDYWAFEMVTHEWIDEEGALRPRKESIIIEPHDTTWMEVLDRILDEMSKHYGYNIKDQVYYAVEFPLNEIDERTGKPFAGYGRCLNDQMLQQLLLAFPEVYETLPFHKPTKDFFA
jgi:hypothetical protein